MFKKASFIVAIILISGLSGIIAEHYLFPRLASAKFFSKSKFLKKATENVTVINKTEQVYVKEESSINKITNKVAPSVVNIAVYSPNNLKEISSKGLIQSFNLTGEIVTSDGIIITYADANQAILNSKRAYKVTTNNGNIYDGILLGVDSWSNLAFIKINASNLPVISFANSDEYSPGEKIIAINNNSSEYQNTFETGVLNSFDPYFNISGEALSKAENLEGVFLTDLNKEIISSGSIVVDYSGQVVGITGKTIKNGKAEYFQIPSNKIRMVLDKFINNYSENNISFGAYYLPINNMLANLNNLKNNKGALIYSASGQQGLAVISGSIADRVGIKIGDVIIKVDDIEVNSKNNLSSILYRYKKGEKANFTIYRNDREMNLEVQF